MKTFWLLTMFPVLFLSDALYGALSYFGVPLLFSPGVLLRGSIVLIAVYGLLSHQKLLGITLSIWISLVIISVIPSLIVGALIDSTIVYDLSALSKSIYLPVMTCFLVVLVRKYKIESDEVLRYIEYSAYFLGSALLLSQTIGIQRHTYGSYAFGNTGVFQAGNDITLALGISLMVAAYRLLFVSFSWLRLALFCVCSLACVKIGTSSSLGIILVIALVVFVLILFGKKRTAYAGNWQTLARTLLGVSIITVASGALFYGFDKQREFDFQQRKFDTLASGELPRTSLVQAGLSHLSNRATVYEFFGEGADSFERGVAQEFGSRASHRMVEVDWLDFQGRYGIGFTLLVYIFVLQMVFSSSRSFVFTRDPFYGLLTGVALLYFCHSALAGHALASPTVSTLIAGCFAILLQRNSINRRQVKKRYLSRQ